MLIRLELGCVYCLLQLTINFQFLECFIFVSSLDLRLPYFRESLVFYSALPVSTLIMLEPLWSYVEESGFSTLLLSSILLVPVSQDFMPLSPCSPTHTYYVYVYVSVFVCVFSFQMRHRGRGAQNEEDLPPLTGIRIQDYVMAKSFPLKRQSLSGEGSGYIF